MCSTFVTTSKQYLSQVKTIYELLLNVVFIVNTYHKMRFVHICTQNIIKPVFCMLLQKSITEEVTLIKKGLSGYAVLRDLK